MSTSQKNSVGLLNTGFGEIFETLKILEKMGITSCHLKNLRKQELPFLDRVSRYMLRGTIPYSKGEESARRLMGEEQFFSLEDWAYHFGEVFQFEKFPHIPEFPLSEVELNSPCPFARIGNPSVAQTHFAFLGLGNVSSNLSNMAFLHNSFNDQFGALSEGSNWILNSDFSKESLKFRWYIFCRTKPKINEFPSYEDQIKGLPSSYEVASVVELIFAEFLRKLLKHKKGDGKFFESFSTFSKGSIASGNRIFLKQVSNSFQWNQFDEASPAQDNDRVISLGVLRKL